MTASIIHHFFMYRTNMCLQMTFPFECWITLSALKWSIVIVDVDPTNVRTSFPLCFESLSAKLTFKFIRMNEKMLRQIVCSFEWSITFRALKWSLVRMNDHMSLQNTLSGECFAAYCTLKWFLHCMYSKMCGAVLFQIKAFWAMTASIVHHLLMYIVNMYLQITLPFEW